MTRDCRHGECLLAAPARTLLADGNSAELRSADGGRSGGHGQITVVVDGEDGDMRRSGRRVDDGQPILIGRHGDIRGSAGKGDGLIECATLVVAEEDGNGLAG